MTDPKENLTPKSTPRRTLGIRRIVPKSAPYSVPLTNRTISTLNPSTSKELPASTGAYSTPVNKQRSKLMLSDSKKISKKLDLCHSPERHTENPPIKTSISVVKSPSAKSLDEQIKQIENDLKHKRQQIQDSGKFMTDINQLTASIVTWKAGAVKALQALKERIEPEQTIEVILEHLRIPLDMFDTSLIE